MTPAGTSSAEVGGVDGGAGSTEHSSLLFGRRDQRHDRSPAGGRNRGHTRAAPSQVNHPLRPHHQWSSPEPLTRRELDRRRTEYFDTRVTGRPETWNAIRMAIETMNESDLGTAQTILDAAGVTLPNGDLVKGAYDELGNLYPLPEYCVCDPINLLPNPAGAGNQDESRKDSYLRDDSAAAIMADTDSDQRRQRREDKGKSVAGEMFKVRIRLSDRGGRDIEMNIGREETIRSLLRRLVDSSIVAEGAVVRIALLGKILKDTDTLHTQGWTSGLVVNAFVSA